MRDLVAELEEEGSELHHKYMKLSEFLDSKGVHKHVDPQQIVLLQDQKVVMAEYLSILANRVRLLKEKK